MEIEIRYWRMVFWSEHDVRHWRRHFETRRSPYKEKKNVIHQSYSVYSIHACTRFLFEKHREAQIPLWNLLRDKYIENIENITENMPEILIFNHFHGSRANPVRIFFHSYTTIFSHAEHARFGNVLNIVGKKVHEKINAFGRLRWLFHSK